MLDQMGYLDAEEYATFRPNPYFVESLDLLRRLTGGDDSRIASFARTCTWAVFTPDTIVRRNGERLLQLLAGHGLHPVAATPIFYNRNIPREFWRRRPYVLIHPARMLVDIYLTRLPSLAVVLQAEALGDGESAAVRLHRVKGPALDVGREPHHIRYAVGTRFPILNGIHAPDSPLDFLTDLGVFLPELRRLALVSAALAPADAAQAVTAELEALHRRQPPRDLDIEASRQRLQACVRVAQETAHGPLAARCEAVAAGLVAIRAGHPQPWLDLVMLLDELEAAHETWDLVLLGASALEGMKLEQYK